MKARHQIAVDAGRISGLWAWDRLTGRSYITDDGVPTSPDAIDSTWLTGVLCRDHPGAAVTTVRVGAGSDGTSARRPLTVEYNDAGVAAGLPTALFSKSTPTLKTRLMYALNDLGLQEGRFFRQIAPTLDIEIPQGHHSAVDKRRGCSVLLLDDLTVTRDATFCDPRTTRFDEAMARNMVELMADYHAELWCSPRFDSDLAWLLTEDQWHRRFADAMGFRRVLERGVRRSRSILPPSILAAEPKMWEAFSRAAELVAREPQTLVHRDTHARNWYVTGDGRMGLLDWQIPGRGCWATDVSYAICCALETEDRRAWERDLLTHYLQRLAKRGVNPPDPEQAWTSYRQQLMHGLGYWVATIGLRTPQPKTQPDDVCIVCIQRLAQAAEDIETLSALGV